MIRQHIFRTILFALIGLGVGFLILQTSPKVYEGRSQLVLGTAQQNAGRFYSSTMSEDVAAILQSGLATNPQTEISIISGEGVFRGALQRVITKTGNTDLQKQMEELYAMYDAQGAGDASAVLVRARAYSPEVATELANSIADAYNETRQNNQRQSISKAIDYLTNQINLEKTDLRKAEEGLKQAKIDLKLPDVGANIARDVEYQAQLRANIDLAKADLAGIDRSITEITSEMNAQPTWEPADQSTVKSATLQSLENQLAELERQKATLLIRYFPDAEEIKYINGAIANVTKQMTDYKKKGFEETFQGKRPDTLRRSLQAQLANAKINKNSIQTKISNLESIYANHTVKVDQVPASVMQLADLAREVELKEGNYKRLTTQMEDLQNRTESGAQPAQIVYGAVPDPNPVLPRPALIYVVATLGGAIFGLLVSFAVEAMRLRIYSSTQLQELTGLPVAGVVHDLPGPTARRLLSSIREPNPIVSESYRFLAFSAMAPKSTGPRKILLTAVDNNAGCSTSAAQFATALAQSGSRVLLVDCALEDPTITKVFGLDQKSGVSDILGQTQLPTPDSSVGTDTAVPNLRVLGAGTEGRNAIKVTNSQNIQGMVDSLASNCDVLVIDSMACLASSDAARLVPYVDDVYLVVSAKTANMRNVAAAIDVLTLASAASLKFIVTKGSRAEEAVMKQANLASVRA